MGHKELNAQRMELYNQGRTDVQLALFYGVKPRVIRQWRNRRGLPSNGKQGGANHTKQHRTVSMQCKPKPLLEYDRQWACYLSDKELNRNIKKLVAEYGIDNKPITRKATAEELAEFESVKPYKTSEAVKYSCEQVSRELQNYSSSAYTKRSVLRPKSTLQILKAKGKIYTENISKVLAI